jgi:putative FmdB family regulatory protein
MPLYEYECIKCNNHTEIFQRISDKPIARCEKCNGKMKKLISQSSFHLKGSGWYVTDYASKSGGYDGKSSGKEITGGTDAAADSPNDAKAESKAGKEISCGSSCSAKKKAKSKD